MFIKNNIRFIRLILLVLIIVGFVLIFTQGLWVPKLVDSIVQAEGTEGQIIKAIFICAGSKTIETKFHNYASAHSVDLKLSDGRELTLSQSISASGARYATADESLVFWNKGDTAFIIEGDLETYVDCVTK